MNILEIFACSGGMAEGFRRAGLPVTIAVDRDDDACASYEANHGHRPIQLDARELLRLVQAGWRPLDRIDLLVADPPCTPWSRAGKRRGTEDERDMLAVAVELVRLLRPRAYLIANIPGLDDAPNWPTVQRTIGGLASDGYCAADFVRLDAADYGVPQRRVRPFWFGHLDGPCVTWPIRTHGSPEECASTLPGVGGLRPWVTCREALAGLSPEELGAPVRLRWKSSSYAPIMPDAPGKVVTSSQPGKRGAVLYTGDHRPSSADAPARTLTTNTHFDGALLVVPHHPISPDEHGLARTVRASSGGTPDKLLAWPWDRPSTVVCAGEVLAPPGRHGTRGESQRAHPNAVKLSERAAAILQGFPDGWTFVGETKRARWSQIGQAMPPPLAEAVARCIARQIHQARKAAA